MSSVTLFYTSPSLNPSDGWLVVAPKLIAARTSDSLIAKVFASSRLSICQIASRLKIWGQFGQFVTWSVCCLVAPTYLIQLNFENQCVKIWFSGSRGGGFKVIFVFNCDLDIHRAIAKLDASNLFIICSLHAILNRLGCKKVSGRFFNPILSVRTEQPARKYKD